MVMRKNWIFVTTFLIITILSAISFNISDVFASSLYADNTVISEIYLNGAEFSKDLHNISYFDVNNNFIAYTCDNQKINILNRRNKAEFEISNLNNVEYLKLTKNYLFVSDYETNSTLKVFNLSNFGEIEIKTESILESYIIENYSEISIIETANNNISQIFIGVLNPTYVKYFYLNENNENLVIDASHTGFIEVKDINKSTTNPITTLSNIAVSNENKVYVVGGDGENQNKLFKISISDTVSISDATLFYPSSATKLVVAQKNLTDYILAISAKHVCIVETNLALSESIEQTNWKKGDETLGDNSGFSLGTINNPVDVKFFGGKMYVSDSGTKSIQSFELNISAETKIIGDTILVASVSGIEGRFNKNATLNVYPNDKILIGDPLNNRIQIINNNSATAIQNSVLSSTNANFPISIGSSMLLYSVNLSSTTSALVKHDLESSAQPQHITSYLRADISTSIPTILSLAYGNGKVYILTTSGILSYSTSSASANYLTFNSAFNISESSKLSYLPKENKLLLYTNNRFFLIELDGSISSTSNLFENVSSITIDSNDNIYALQGSKILKIATSLNFQSLGEITNSKFSNFSSISINEESGILYAFNNNVCCIETIINPDFNYIEKTTSIKTANAITYVFAKPSGLNANNIEVLETLEIDSFKDIYSKHPISVDGNSFFMVYMENGYGFINSADVFFNDEDVMNLQESNARIKGYEANQQIKVYKFNKIDETEIKTYLTDDYRIFVENYDKDAPLTYISFYDENQKQQVGYVETKYIKFNQLSSFQSTAIIILGIALVCGILLFVFYKKANDRRKA